MSRERPVVPLMGLLKTVHKAEQPRWLDVQAPKPMFPAAEKPAAAKPTPEPPSPDESAEAAQIFEAELARRQSELEAQFAKELSMAKAELEAQVRAKVEADLAATKARYADAIKVLTEAAEEIRGTYSTRTIELGLVIAREVLGRELSFDRAGLVARVEEALAAAGDDPAIKVRLGTADAAYLLRTRPDLLNAGVELVEEASLAPGACFVESSRRLIDASIEVRLSMVRGVLDDVCALADSEEKETKGAH